MKEPQTDSETLMNMEEAEAEAEAEAETRIEKKKKKKKRKRDRVDVCATMNEPQTDSQTLTNMEEAEAEAEAEAEKKKKKKRERVDVKMEIVHEQPDKIAPLIGYFPSGFDPHKDSSTNEEEEHEPPRVRVFRNKSRPNRLQLVVSPNESKVEFVGTNYSGEATAAQVCTYALGILDKDTQTLKVVPIAANKIFRLEPRVGGSSFSDKEPSSLLKGEFTAEQKADKMRELTNLYGTKKSITRAKKLWSLNQKEDPRSQKDLDRKIEGIVINKEALESAGTYNARNIPPHDSSATTPEKAYSLDKIILKGEWDYLLDILELSQVGAEVTPGAFPSFVCNRIHKLGEIQDETEKTTLACILSYITHLIKFKDQHSMDGVSSAKHHKIPSILLQKFSIMFADPESKRLSDEKNALLVSYVLVLSLFADGFRTDLSDVAKDLRMTTITLRPHYEYLGCKLVREGNLLLATLPVPLQFPKPRVHKRRK